MQGELSPESAATINRLASSFSCFAVDASLEAVVAASYRRCLTFPLYRSFEVCELVHSLTARVFSSGRTALLKLLIELHRLLAKSEPRHLLNEIFLDDLLVYLQQADESHVKAMGEKMKAVKVTKANLALGLEQAETQALKEFVECSKNPG